MEQFTNPIEFRQAIYDHGLTKPRRGQGLMAWLVEAGTGSGKSFAHLIPLVWTGKRVFQVRRTAKARCI